jgi:renalase
MSLRTRFSTPDLADKGGRIIEKAERIAVIGAGMAGLSCARRLADAGYAPVVFDKGRGIGGRLATRRTPDGLQFEHGAQYVTARSAGFEALLEQARTAGAAALWTDGAEGTDRPHSVGTPGMNALAKHLARGLAIRQGIQVTALREAGRGWTLTLPGEEQVFDRVVVTVPAPHRPFARDTSGTLYAGGDWCLGPRVEAAWSSGEAMAQDILNTSILE